MTSFQQYIPLRSILRHSAQPPSARQRPDLVHQAERTVRQWLPAFQPHLDSPRPLTPPRALAGALQERAGLQRQLEEKAAARWAAEQRQQLRGEQLDLLLHKCSEMAAGGSCGGGRNNDLLA
ncbi:hypothetical protein ACK3TF_003401 [Chlorella vulgaris]